MSNFPCHALAFTAVILFLASRISPAGSILRRLTDVQVESLCIQRSAGSQPVRGAVRKRKKIGNRKKTVGTHPIFPGTLRRASRCPCRERTFPLVAQPGGDASLCDRRGGRRNPRSCSISREPPSDGPSAGTSPLMDGPLTKQ